MRVLACDTALDACSAAVWADGEVLAWRWEGRARGHAEALMPMIEAVRREADLPYRRLDLLAVTVGPGTFTGLRIGLAAMRGLALVSGLPLAGVTTLEAIAAGVEAGVRRGEPLAVVLDARRGQLYGQAFDARLTPLGDPRILAPARALELLPERSGAVVGTGAPLVAATLGTAGVGAWFPDAPILPDARVIAPLAAAKAAHGLPAEPPSPLYLRPPDARLPTKKPRGET